jgi:hypothetical protein
MPTKIGVNDSCPCGSGKKYKKCCRLKNIVDVGPEVTVQTSSGIKHISFGEVQTQNGRVVHELGNDVMYRVLETQNKYVQVMQYIHTYTTIRDTLSTEIYGSLIRLSHFWITHDIENTEIDGFFKIKEHHSYINGSIEDEKLKTLWDNYIISSSELRLELMQNSVR